MDGKNIQSIIVMEDELELGCKIADRPTDDAEANGGS
jgi:hypothetical protein